MQLVYKLVNYHPELGRRASWSTISSSKYRQIYPIGETIHAYKLFVFDSHQAAQWFYEDQGGRYGEVWECETTSTTPAPDFVLGTGILFDDLFYNYWMAALGHSSWSREVARYLIPTPPHTLLVNDLKLVRNVTNEPIERWVLEPGEVV